MKSLLASLSIAVVALSGAPCAAVASPAVKIDVPSGTYRMDPDHSIILFQVNHKGVSNFTARFIGYDVKIMLDASNIAGSSVIATIDPTSVRADYTRDYQATHRGETKFKSWDEDLAQSQHFFNADKYPKITFISKRVEQGASGTLKIIGDLTFLGQTHPVTLDAALVGAHAEGNDSMMGFSATGSLQRSVFGMNYLQGPGYIGDTVTVRIEGEFANAKSAYWSEP